jgi:hypothetical protein
MRRTSRSSRFTRHGLWRWRTFSKHPVKNGVLEVRMPKTDEAKKKAISVKIDEGRDGQY